MFCASVYHDDDVASSLNYPATLIMMMLVVVVVLSTVKNQYVQKIIWTNDSSLQILIDFPRADATIILLRKLAL